METISTKEKTLEYNYRGLSCRDRRLYRAIEDAVRTGGSAVPCDDPVRFHRVLTAFLYDHPEVSDIDPRDLTFDRSAGTVGFGRIDEDLAVHLGEVSDDIRCTFEHFAEDRSQEDVAFKVMVSLVSNFEHIDEPGDVDRRTYIMHNTAPGAWLSGKAGCEGFSKLASFVLNGLGIASSCACTDGHCFVLGRFDDMRDDTVWVMDPQDPYVFLSVLDGCRGHFGLSAGEKPDLHCDVVGIDYYASRDLLAKDVEDFRRIVRTLYGNGVHGTVVKLWTDDTDTAGGEICDALDGLRITDGIDDGGMLIGPGFVLIP